MERRSALRDDKKQTKSEIMEEQGQMSMYNYKLAEVAHQLDLVDLNNMTPMEAMNILAKLKESLN